MQQPFKVQRVRPLENGDTAVLSGFWTNPTARGSFHALENSCSVVYLWPTQAATHSLTPHILTSVYRKGTGLTEEVVVMNLTLSSDRPDASCSSLKSPPHRIKYSGVSLN